mgnify:CR=1 FL=1
MMEARKKTTGGTKKSAAKKRGTARKRVGASSRVAKESGAAQRIIQLMMDGRLDPAEMANELGLSLEQMAEAGTEAATLRTLLRLAGLADLRARMVVSRFRMEAAARLVQMATEGEATELARKACVDLLRLDLDAHELEAGGATARSGDEPPADAEAARAPTEEAIRTALAELGEAMA